MKNITILIITIYIALTSFAYAEQNFYQKVTRKKVEIVTTDKTNTATNNEPAIIDVAEESTPAAPPVTQGSDDEDPVIITNSQNRQKRELISTSEEDAGNWYAIKFGSIAPGSGFVAQGTLWPYEVSSTSELRTNIGLGFAQSGDYQSLMAYIQELFAVKNSDTITVYAGAGINIPLSAETGNGQLSMDLVAGAEFDIDIIKGTDEKIFVESGFSSYAVTSPNKYITKLTLMGGYKFKF